MHIRLLCVSLLCLNSLYAEESAKITKMKAACERDMRGACYELGLLYESGLKVEKNTAIATNYYKKACELGYDEACRKREQLQIKNLEK